MIRARLKIATSSKKVSQSLVRAVEPDNLKMKGLRVDGRATPASAEFLMVCDGKIETFISTLDDMLACLLAAKGTLNRLNKDME